VVPKYSNVNITLSGYHCSNGYAQDSNQKYLYVGSTPDFRSYYRGATNEDMYIYYDRRCDDGEITCGAWILRRKPEDVKEESLDNARITFSDFGLPVGPQKWDWIWCGDHRSSGHTLTVDVEMHPTSPPQMVVQESSPMKAAKSVGMKKRNLLPPILPTKVMKAETYNMVV